MRHVTFNEKEFKLKVQTETFELALNTLKVSPDIETVESVTTEAEHSE